MAINLDEYQELKERADDLKSQADRAQGALEQHMKTLEEEFDCTTIKQAEKLVEELKVKQDKIEIQYTKELKEFKEKWKDQL